MRENNKTEQRICDAIIRLLGGHSLLTDGRLTVTNLALEARVSRATVNRSTVALDRFRRAVSDRKKGVREAQVTDNKPSAHQHILAQHIQARAMFRRQEERRASRADVLPFPRQQR